MFKERHCLQLVEITSSLESGDEITGRMIYIPFFLNSLPTQGSFCHPFTSNICTRLKVVKIWPSQAKPKIVEMYIGEEVENPRVGKLSYLDYRFKFSLYTGFVKKLEMI